MYYQVENGHDRDGLGSEENYFWKTAKERNDVEEKEERKPFEPKTGNVDINVDRDDYLLG